MQWELILVAGKQDKNVYIFSMYLDRLIIVMVIRWILYTGQIRLGNAAAVNNFLNLSSFKFQKFIFLFMIPIYMCWWVKKGMLLYIALTQGRTWREALAVCFLTCLSRKEQYDNLQSASQQLCVHVWVYEIFKLTVKYVWNIQRPKIPRQLFEKKIKL